MAKHPVGYCEAVMANPTKAQWEEVKNELSMPYGRAFFKCDDYLIAAEVQQRKMKLQITVYVNSWIKAEWCWHGKEKTIDQMPEIAKRFYCLKKKGPSAKTIAKDQRIFGKKRCREKGWHEPILSAVPWFSTSGAFIAHLKKHNPSIEVIDFETYKIARDALPVEESNTEQEMTGDGNA
jgi:hypothetical protein